MRPSLTYLLYIEKNSNIFNLFKQEINAELNDTEFFRYPRRTAIFLFWQTIPISFTPESISSASLPFSNTKYVFTISNTALMS